MNNTDLIDRIHFFCYDKQRYYNVSKRRSQRKRRAFPSCATVFFYAQRCARKIAGGVSCILRGEQENTSSLLDFIKKEDLNGNN